MKNKIIKKSSKSKKRKNKSQSIILSKNDKAELIIKKNENKAKLAQPTKLKSAKKSTSVKKVFKNTDDIILISVDRNWLARRSQELSQIMNRNNIRDPKMLDGNILSETLMCKGANDQILEILDKYENA